MREKASKDFHHARVQLLFLSRTFVPRFHVRVVTRKLGVLRDNTQFLLLLENLFAIGFPAVVEHAPIPVNPFLRNVVGRVRCAGTEIHEERLLRRHLLGVGNEADCLIRQVCGQMVAFFRRLLRLDLMVVVDQVRIILMRVAAHKSVEPLEAAAKRPAVVRAGCRNLVRRC